MEQRKKIAERQNEPLFKSRLAAQRYLYAQAKQANGLFLWLAFGLPMVYIAAFIWRQGDITPPWFWGAALVLVIVLFIKHNYVSIKKRRAALIQELFDTELLGIAWSPEIKKDARLTEEYIRCTAIRLEDQSKLENWYSDYEYEDATPHDLALAPLKCQQENLYWDGKQKQRYLKRALIFIVLLAAGVGWSLWSLALPWDPYLLLPFAGLIFLPLQAIWLALNSYLLMDRFYKIKCELDGLEDISEEALKALQRKVQDFIYKNRRRGALVPEWFYASFKDRIGPKIYRFSAQDGRGDILIETKEWTWWSANKVAGAVQNFDQAFASIDNLSKAVIDKMEAANANEVTLEMSLKVSGDLGAYIAKANGEGQVKVTVKWTKDEKA